MPCFIVTAEGLQDVTPRAEFPTFKVRPGSDLTLSVSIVVPRRTLIRQLWLGIGHAHEGGGPHGPTGVHPILLHNLGRLAPGRDDFTLSWRVPAKIGDHTSLSASWQYDDVTAEVDVATFKG
jgi:hypothetical protein